MTHSMFFLQLRMKNFFIKLNNQNQSLQLLPLTGTHLLLDEQSVSYQVLRKECSTHIQTKIKAKLLETRFNCLPKKLFYSIELKNLSESISSQINTDRVSPIVIGECVEKYLVTRLYDHLFCPNKTNDDIQLFHKISLLKKFISAEHLDIPSQYVDSTLWSVAQQG